MRDEIAYRISRGDEKAFELLFRKMYPRLCCYANKFLNNPEEAREIIQEVFSAVWTNRKNLRPDFPLEAYLYKIAKNLSICRLRRRKIESIYIEIYQAVYIEYDEENPVHENLCAEELEKKINTAVSKLPECCKKIFELSRVDGLKYKEIAEALQISIKTVEAQMSKALRLLKLELSEFLIIFITILFK